jgi:hypothetical protein
LLFVVRMRFQIEAVNEHLCIILLRLIGTYVIDDLNARRHLLLIVIARRELDCSKLNGVYAIRIVGESTRRSG